MRFLIFRLIMTSIVLLVQWYLYRRASLYLRSHTRSQWAMRVLQFLFILFNLPLPFLIFVRPQAADFPSWLFTFGVYPFYTWHGALFLLFLIVSIAYLLRQLFSVTVRLTEKLEFAKRALSAARRRTSVEPLDGSRRVFLQKGFTVVVGATFAGTAYGLYSKDDHEISRIRVGLKNLPAQFEGFTITLFADIHSSVFMSKEDMVRYVKIVNKQSSDVIVIPGDFVNSMVEEVYPLAEAFSDLRARHGVFGSLGNHDFFTNVDIVAREIDQCGITLLRNDWVKIEKDGAMIQLAGVDDTGRSERAAILYGKALEGTTSSLPRILLCHRPYFMDESSHRKIDLTLAGHTHGGQIVFTKIGSTIIAPARIVSPYVAGLYRKGESQLYVTRGLGTVGMPVRINCPPEITVITLVNAS